MSNRAVIVGAGAVGCLSALALRRRGWEVTLLDKGALGAESSWAGGGILFPLLPWNYREPVNRLALAGAATYLALCEALRSSTGIDPQYQASGMLLTDEFGGQSALDWCRAHGLEAQPEPSGLWLPGVGQVRNPRLMQALHAELQRSGVRVVEDVTLAPLAAHGMRLSAWESASGERFEADAFVLTAGAWSQALLGAHALGVQVKPMRGQMLLFWLAPGRLTRILYRQGFYLIPRLDGHILAGSTVEDVGFDKSTTAGVAADLAAQAASLLPELAGAPVIQHWSGLRPGSPDNVPVIARHPQFDNLYLNTGHFRYGVTMAPASAAILEALVCGDAPPPGVADYAFPS